MFGKEAIGQLVIAEWWGDRFVGELTDIKGKEASVSAFGNHNLGFPRHGENVELYSEYIERKRARKFKVIFKELFGGKPLKRVTAENLKLFHRTLKKYGFECDTKRPKADEFVIVRRNPAFLGRRKNGNGLEPRLPEETAKWLPGWNVAEALDSSSRDPLGLMAGAEALANGLLPGMTVFVFRAGYFFFLAWALDKLDQIEGRRREQLELLNRMERIIVLCEALYHGVDGLDECRHQGQRRKRALIHGANNGYRADIPDTILKNQANSGCYNLYRTAMVSCGFWEEDDLRKAEGRIPYRLTELGTRLARSFADRSASEHIWNWAYKNGGSKSMATLQEWGRALCFNTFTGKTERTRFLDGFIRPAGAGAEVMRAASSRCLTLQALGKMALTNRRSGGSKTPAGSIRTRDGMVEYDGVDSSENLECLLTFYEKRSKPGAEPFVAGAIYELLALAANGLWAEMCEAVRGSERKSIAGFIGAVTADEWWDRKVASVSIRSSERDLAEEVADADGRAQRCMKLLVAVLRRADNRPFIERDPLSASPLLRVLDVALSGDVTLRAALTAIVGELLRHHRRVSANKRKDIWLETDGSDFWEKELPDMTTGLQFHSFRFPQLRSIMSDLDVSPEDIEADER